MKKLLVFCLCIIASISPIISYETSYEAWGFGHGWPYYGSGYIDTCCFEEPLILPYPDTYPLSYARFIHDYF